MLDQCCDIVLLSLFLILRSELLKEPKLQPIFYLWKSGLLLGFNEHISEARGKNFSLLNCFSSVYVYDFTFPLPEYTLFCCFPPQMPAI